MTVVTRGGRTIDLLLFATAFVITFAKIRWETPVGDVYLSDVSATLFVLAVLASRLWARDSSLPRPAAVVTLFFALFLVVFLVSFYNLTTTADRELWVRGLIKFAVHFGFIVVAVSYLARRSPRLYWQALGFFLAGFVANAIYGVLQLGFVEATGRNLDEVFLGALGVYEGGGIGVFGVAAGQTVYRTNALTLDANHLGVMLVVPVMILLALYLRLERGHRLRTPAALAVGFLFCVQLTTLSRSAMLGIATGLVVLAIPYHHLLLRPRFLVPVAALGLVVVAVAATRTDFVREVFAARTQASGPGAQTHFEFYRLVRPAFEMHPLFGMGWNTFPTYYEFQTGRPDYGPHSFYVALISETGVVGVLVFFAWLAYLFRRILALRRVGRRFIAAGDRMAERASPLAWGLAAALLGTMAGNIFYLTMQMYYFFLLAVFIVAAPAVFGSREPVRP